MLKDRIVSSVVGIPLVLLFLFLGRYVFAFMVAVIVLLSMDELYSILAMREYRPNVMVGIITGTAIVVGALVGGLTGMMLVITVATAVVMMWQIFNQGSILNASLTMIALLYIALTLSHLTLLYDLPFGLIGVLMVFVGTWISDIAAYSIGSAFGKRKLMPSVSANKTLEGFLAGILFPAVVIAILFTLSWLPLSGEQGTLYAALKGIAMGLIIGIAAPVGDLVESRIKREMRIKDSGALIPGHGGFLDRFDSLIFTAVAGYYYWLLVVK
jgi:phosphatidate cytidylyltransferase